MKFNPFPIKIAKEVTKVHHCYTKEIVETLRPFAIVCVGNNHPYEAPYFHLGTFSLEYFYLKSGEEFTYDIRKDDVFIDTETSEKVTINKVVNKSFILTNGQTISFSGLVVKYTWYPYYLSQTDSDFNRYLNFAISNDKKEDFYNGFDNSEYEYYIRVLNLTDEKTNFFLNKNNA